MFNKISIRLVSAVLAGVVIFSACEKRENVDVSQLAEEICSCARTYLAAVDALDKNDPGALEKGFLLVYQYDECVGRVLVGHGVKASDYYDPLKLLYDPFFISLAKAIDECGGRIDKE